MIKKLKVKTIGTCYWMNEKALDLVHKFNASGMVLYLDVYEDYQSRTLEDIMEEGMYDYSFNKENELSEEFLIMLDEAEGYARFLDLTPEVVEIVG